MTVNIYQSTRQFKVGDKIHFGKDGWVIKTWPNFDGTFNHKYLIASDDIIIRWFQKIYVSMIKYNV